VVNFSAIGQNAFRKRIADVVLIILKAVTMTHLLPRNRCCLPFNQCGRMRGDPNDEAVTIPLFITA